MKNLFAILIGFVMLSAFSCEQTVDEKAQATLDAKIESGLEYADKTGTGLEVRKQIAELLSNNTRDSFEKDEYELEQLSKDFNVKESEAMRYAIREIIEEHKERLAEEAKVKADAEAEAKAEEASSRLKVRPEACLRQAGPDPPFK